MQTEVSLCPSTIRRAFTPVCFTIHQTWSIQIKVALNAGILRKDVAALVEQRSGPKKGYVRAIEARNRSALRLVASPPWSRRARSSSPEDCSRQCQAELDCAPQTLAAICYTRWLTCEPANDDLQF
jgi:hypothetical protein